MRKNQISSLSNLKPFIKWVGGKRALLPELLRLMPKKFNNYFEPFVGGGALFFELTRLGALNGKKAYLFDVNAELVNTYQTVKKHPKKLLKQLKEFQTKHSEEFYYSVRAMDREEGFKSLPLEVRAARFIYLNKTCFNGLWRVNKQGYNNSGSGRYKNPKIYDEETLMAASIVLQNAEIQNADFSEVIKFADNGDFVYFDPPYYPLNATSFFTTYHESGFLDEEQKRLYTVFKELDEKGISVMESNSNTEFIKELYKEYNIEFVEAPRFINGKGDGRGKIKEVVIRNNYTDNSVFSLLEI
jgi:DNA adenine methylase